MARKRLTSKQKQLNKYQRVLDRAIKRHEEMQAHQRRLDAAYIRYESIDDTKLFAKAQALLDRARANKPSTKISKTLKSMFEEGGYLRDASKAHWYEKALVYEDIVQVREGNVTIPETRYHSVFDVIKAVDKMNKDPASLSYDDSLMVARWFRANNAIYNQKAQQRLMRNRNDRDTRFGGTSQLINDLTYMYNMRGPKGDEVRAIVDGLKKAMEDPAVFDAVETIYLHTESGRSLRDSLNAAMEQRFYEETVDSMKAIAQIMNGLVQNGTIKEEDLDGGLAYHMSVVNEMAEEFYDQRDR